MIIFVLNVGTDIVKKIVNIDKRLQSLETLELSSGSSTQHFGQYGVRWTHHYTNVFGAFGYVDVTSVTNLGSTFTPIPVTGDIITAEVCFRWKPIGTGTMSASAIFYEEAVAKDTIVQYLADGQNEIRNCNFFLHWTVTSASPGRTRARMNISGGGGYVRIYSPVELYHVCWTPV